MNKRVLHAHHRLYAFNINPEPWRVPPMSPARKGDKLYVASGRDQGLHSYQEAVREEFGEPDIMEGELALNFYFWRQLPSYTTDSEKKHQKHIADATNLQKALEDALQGYLFENDRTNRHVSSTIMAQGADVEPRIGIEVSQWTRPLVWADIFYEMLAKPINQPTLSERNTWPPR